MIILLLTKSLSHTIFSITDFEWVLVTERSDQGRECLQWSDRLV
jgi:hypothetical protein